MAKVLSETVAPSSLVRASAVADQLRKVYVKQPAAICQSVVAHLHGYADWYALERACNGGKRQALSFDEEVSSDRLIARLREQRAIICGSLAGIDRDGDYPIPAPTDYTNDPQALLQDAALGPFSGWSQLRTKNARARFHVRLSSDVLDEIRPTSSLPPPPRLAFDFDGICRADEYRALPRRLGDWWAANVTANPGAGRILRGMELDPNRQVSILQFAWHWVELCLRHPGQVGPDVLVGTAYLLADRYATLVAQNSAPLSLALQAIPDLGVSPTPQFRQTFRTLHTPTVLSFFGCIPRDDLAGAYAAHPQSFVDSARGFLGLSASTAGVATSAPKKAVAGLPWPVAHSAASSMLQ